MARKKKHEVVEDDLAGTVEGLALDHFEREKAAYEKRTGEKVQFEPPVPVTRTPVKSSVSSESSPSSASEDGETPQTDEAEGEGAE